MDIAIRYGATDYLVSYAKEGIGLEVYCNINDSEKCNIDISIIRNVQDVFYKTRKDLDVKTYMSMLINFMRQNGLDKVCMDMYYGEIYLRCYKLQKVEI